MVARGLKFYREDPKPEEPAPIKKLKKYAGQGLPMCCECLEYHTPSWGWNSHAYCRECAPEHLKRPGDFPPFKDLP